MTTTNLYRRLRELLPDAPVMTATVQAVFADGTALVAFPGGGEMRVRNRIDAFAGVRVFVQGDAVIDAAPDLPYERIEV